MSCLTISPKPEVFASVPHLDDAVVNFRAKNARSLINKVGQVFVKHNAYKDFGLSMIHRHFDLSGSDEILVETINNLGTESITVPWKINGSTAEPCPEETWSSAGLSKRKLIVPQNWLFNNDGDLIPYEYIGVDNATEGSGVPTEQFASDLHSALKKLGIEKIIGLRRITFYGGLSKWETTPEGIRASVTAIGKLPEDVDQRRMIKVTWYFDENGNIPKDGGLCQWCCHYCGRCRTCRN